MRSFLLLSLLVVFAHESISMTQKQLDTNIQACLAKNKLSPHYYKSSDDNLKYLTDEQKSCFLACMFKEFGIIQDDGSVHSVQDVMDQETADVISNCTATANSDVCKLAGCLFKSQKFYVPIKSDYPKYN